MMFFMLKKAFIVTLLILLTFSVSEVGASPWPGDEDCGTAVDGLQICLATSGSNLQLTLRNVGDHDLTLNLGMMLANGKVQLPTRVAMKVTDAQGKTRVFEFFDKRHASVGGRVDDYVVFLRAGSSYTLQLSLDQFWCQESKEFSIPLLSGDNYLTAQLEGSGATFVNLDMPGIKHLKFWLGKVHSNTLTLRP